MICEHCKGVGYVINDGYYSSWLDECIFCDGKGVVEPMTNEEWLRSCTTEQLAELIYEIAVTDKLMDRFFNAEIVYGHSGTEEAMDWLKEVHQ
jgi:hypothetical protein